MTAPLRWCTGGPTRTATSPRPPTPRCRPRAPPRPPASSGTPARSRSTAPGRSAIRCGCCPGTGCSTAGPRWAWSPSRRRRPGWSTATCAELASASLRQGGMGMGEFVRLEVADGIGTIRLDRPPVNAMNDQLTSELADAARAASDADAGQIRAVILYGGEKAFAAGADIANMAEAGYAEMALRSGRLQAAMGLIAGLGQPVIAAITGYALGGGLELALAADFRVAGESARLGQPEILLGVIPGAGGTQRLPRMIGPARAKDIVFSGRFVEAVEALDLGLVDRVAPDAEVYDVARSMVA